MFYRVLFCWKCLWFFTVFTVCVYITVLYTYPPDAFHPFISYSNVIPRLLSYFSEKCSFPISSNGKHHIFMLISYSILRSSKRLKYFFKDIQLRIREFETSRSSRSTFFLLDIGNVSKFITEKRCLLSDTLRNFTFFHLLSRVFWIRAGSNESVRRITDHAPRRSIPRRVRAKPPSFGIYLCASCVPLCHFLSPSDSSLLRS